MKTLLLVAATEFEIQPTIKWLSENGGTQLQNLTVEVLVTGAGMVKTAFELGRRHGKKYDYAVNAGVAGSFGKFRVGDVVNVYKDCFSEFGAEDGEEFLPIDEMKLGTQHVTAASSIQAEITTVLPLVKGITVNTVHGNEISIKKVADRTSADVKSMEGAAFLEAANLCGWKCLQLRAISNLVEKRNKENWNLELAIKNLNEVLGRLLRELGGGSG